MQKIDSVDLRFIPQLRTALSPAFRLHLMQVWKGIKITASSTDDSLCNFYESFHFALGNKNYSGTDILNNSDLLVDQYLDLLLYLRDYFYLSEQYLSSVTWAFFQAFKNISKRLCFTECAIFEIDSRRNAINESLVLLRSRSIGYNDENIRIMCCRTVTTSLGDKKKINLSKFQMHYGEYFTNLMFNQLNNYAQKTITTTFNSNFGNFLKYGSLWTDVEPSLKGLELALRANNVSIFFESCMLLGFAKSEADGNDPKAFLKGWAAFASFYKNVLSNKSDVFQKPSKEILCPNFKDAKRSPSFAKSKGVQAIIMNKWIVNIPLHLKDSEAVDLLKVRVTDDIDYLSSFLKQEFDVINERMEITESTYPNEKINSIYEAIFSSESWRNIYQEYNYWSYTEMQFAYSIPTLTIIQYLSGILVMEHPSITPSWLAEWKLYDRNGNLDGYKQVGEQWVIESLKRRRGVSKSQQIVTLNQYTRRVVELIIKLTKFVRDYLKENEDERYRYTLLYCNGSSIDLFSTYGFAYKILNLIHDPRKLRDISKRITNRDAAELASLISFRSLRRSMALYDYLKNQSVTSAAKVLGHSKVRWELITSYIPQALIDFFNARWVRQFQNAIVFEVMKDSPQLFEAIDIEPVDLPIFLKNHGLKNLPTMVAPELSSDGETNTFGHKSIKQIIFTISTGLLQVFIAIRELVDGLSSEEKLIDLAHAWYESAEYVLKTIELEEQCEEQLIKMYNLAIENPLDINVLRKALLWKV
jgi:hypothetical protein